MAKRIALSSFAIAVVAIAVAMGASAKAASDYFIPFDRPGKVTWFIFRSEVKQLNEGRFAVDVFQLVDPPEAISGQSAPFATLHFIFNCSDSKFNPMGLTWVDENNHLVGIGQTNGAAQAPIAASPGSNVHNAMEAVCAPNGPHWMHSDDDWWTILRRRLTELRERAP